MAKFPLAVRESWCSFAPRIGTGDPLPYAYAATKKKGYVQVEDD